MNCKRRAEARQDGQIGKKKKKKKISGHEFSWPEIRYTEEDEDTDNEQWPRLNCQCLDIDVVGPLQPRSQINSTTWATENKLMSIITSSVVYKAVY